jgi:Secretion system C-terminal sorting domain
VLIGLCGLLCSTSSGVGIYEANTKSVNDIYLRTIAKDAVQSVTTTDKIVIDYIASQCPYTGGTAVYVARALQAAMRRDTFYNDTENCFAQGVNYRIVKPKDEVKTVDTDGNNIKLYPNPTTNFVVIKSNKALTGRLNVLNSIGQVVSTLALQGQKDLIISTSDLPEGMYFVNTYDEQGIYFKEKLIRVCWKRQHSHITT